jgi:hypothetical protein
MEYRLGMMLGRLTDGRQADHGKLVHAVVEKFVKPRPNPSNDWGRNAERMAQPVVAEVSLCGKRPGRRSVGWDFRNFATDHPEVTCPRCAKKVKQPTELTESEKQGIRNLEVKLRKVAVELWEEHPNNPKNKAKKSPQK